MAWLQEPKSILTANSGTLELADGGDPAVAAKAINRLPEQFEAVVRDRLFRKREVSTILRTTLGLQYFSGRAAGESGTL